MKPEIRIEIYERDNAILSLWCDKLQEKINKVCNKGYEVVAAFAMGQYSIMVIFKSDFYRGI